MKRLLTGIAATVLTVPAMLLVAVPVSAAGEGQIEGGDIYRVRNLTKNGAFTDPATADACDTVQYRVRIHNPGPGGLTNVNVKATLPGGVASSNISTLTVSAVNADPQSTSDTATVNLSSAQNLAYVSGSTQLLDANGSVMQSLADGILGGGITIGNVGVSINEKRFVQFQAKINCPQPPAQSSFKCEELSVTKLSRTKFEFTATASATNAAISAYVFTAKDASGNVVNTQTVATSATSAKYVFEQSKAGAYTVSVVVKTDKGDAPVNGCTRSVTVEAEPVTPTPPAAPMPPAKELPDTGAGAILGIFAGVSTLAGGAHYIVSRFRQ